MLIPITFNADDTNNERKGKIRGQDLASFLSISMPKRAGILDIYENPCSQYGAINVNAGYATITLHAGYINIYGRCIYIEEGTQVNIQLPSDSSTINGYFGLRIDLSETGANEVTWFTKTTTLQTDNLLNNETSGVYEFAIYTYTATASSLTLNSKVAPVIQNIADYLKGANFDTQAVGDSSNKIATTQFVANSLVEYSKNFKKKDYVNTNNSKQYQGTQFKIANMVVITGELLYPEAGATYTINWESDYSITGLPIIVATLGEMYGTGNPTAIVRTGAYSSTSAQIEVATFSGSSYATQRAKVNYIIIGKAQNE